MSQVTPRFGATPRFAAVVSWVVLAGCARTDRVIGVRLDAQTDAGASSGGAAGSAASPEVGATKDGEAIISRAGLTSVALGGYLNGESYQQDGILSFMGYQYVAFWNSKRHVVLARRGLPDGAWATIEFTDYANIQSVAADTISVGICPEDGTIHLAFDNLPFNDDRLSEMHYRVSLPGLATAAASWSTASFSSVTSQLVQGTVVHQLGYPRFVTQPNGKLLFEGSINGGNNGGADEHLWEYAGDTHRWTALGRFIAGIDETVTAYTHGLAYARGGTRLHLTWCWREDTTDVSTNHDLLYIYSDDNGRTWQNGDGDAVASTGISAVSKATSGIEAEAIGQQRGMINQEHMTVGAKGDVHVLLSHMPDAEADEPSFSSARSKSKFFHYSRSTEGEWTRAALELPVIANFRGKFALAASGNLYAVLPDLRIAAASAATRYRDWRLIDSVDAGRFFSDPLIDSSRLVVEDKLSIFYPQKASPNLYVLDYSLR